MSNKEIAGLFSEHAALMELHGENEFKTKVYQNAYLSIKKIDIPLLDLDQEALHATPGLSKTIIEKLSEIKTRHTFDALEQFRLKTPEGVRQLLKIKGLGPKKVRLFWKDMQWESPGELYYACLENRLIELKGFGKKTQDDIIKNIEYFNESSNQFLYASLEKEADQILTSLRKINPETRFEWTGDFHRKNIFLSQLQLLCNSAQVNLPENIVHVDSNNYLVRDLIPLQIISASPDNFLHNWILSTGGSEEFAKQFLNTEMLNYVPQENKKDDSESSWFASRNLPWVPAECRDLDFFDNFDASQIIEESDIRGVIHNHSTYSDGLYSIEEMALECIRLKYEYLVISDHSRAAFYANGLSMEHVEQQWREIDALNEKLKPFKIYKSIESDILADGSLDYPEDFLKGFDLVIASIHSNLKMDEEKAMMRLIKAIENPATRILGHPTGRLLLSRKGYPVNHKKLIDACAANHVSIEINANPLRLDMDWQYIPYAMERGVIISINPDAHNLKGIQDIKYGVLAARKGGLLKNYCLNIKTISEFDSWISA